MGGERAAHTLQTTALVNEAYLRLIDGKQVNWQNRAHFFAISARLMRRILVDWARSRQSQKRGDQPQRVTLDEALIVSRGHGEDLVGLDEALKTLAEVDPRKSQVVEMRFFGGLSVEETAEVLKVSPTRFYGTGGWPSCGFCANSAGKRMIDPERWHQIEQICEAALEREAGERAAFLKEACGKDEGLRREVESMLAHEETAEGFIEVPALEAAAKVLAEDRNPSLLGQQIGSYQILSLLGAGGMGAVYRARDTRLGREVAIKVLPSAFSTDADRLRRFEQEARAAGQLNHPNILAIYDVGTHKGSPYIVCERLEGETLRDRLKRTALPQRRAIEVAVQIARGLAAAHEKGIVHRDLKPENLFLTSDGRLKILDFGLAKLTRPQSDGSRTDSTESQVGTLSGLVLGTVGYMAPEQVRGRQWITARTSSTSGPFSTRCSQVSGHSGASRTLRR